MILLGYLHKIQQLLDTYAIFMPKIKIPISLYVFLICTHLRKTWLY